MIFTVTFIVFLVSFTQAATPNGGFSAPQTGSGNSQSHNTVPKKPKIYIYVMDPNNRTKRADTEIQGDQPFGGYFYPKPIQNFNLPSFKTVDANAPQRAAFVEETEQFERQSRSPQRRNYPNFPSPQTFMPGFTPPNQIRPLPALYVNPMRFY